MVRVTVEDRPLTATAALIWNGDLPSRLQQMLYDAADGIAADLPRSLGYRTIGKECWPTMARPALTGANPVTEDEWRFPTRGTTPRCVT
jgi:hypothetical protein